MTTNTKNALLKIADKMEQVVRSVEWMTVEEVERANKESEKDAAKNLYYQFGVELSK